jgi:drug/metabolite transporter (DMT)-like permease
MAAKQLKGSVAAMLVNIIFGFSFLFSKIALRYAHPLVILSVRFTTAFLVLNFLWAFGVFKLRLRGKPKKTILLMAAAQPLLYYIFELYGIDKTSSAISGVIISLVPVFAVVLSAVFLKERATAQQIIFSAVSFGAVVVISFLSNDGAATHLIGILLLLGAAFCSAVFNILSRKESEHYSPFERTYIMFLVGAVGFNAVAALLLRENYVPEIISAFQSIEFWGAIFYLAVVSSIIVFMLYNYATSHITPVRSASFSNLTTVVSVLAGIFILNEQLRILQILCCLVIIIGVFGVNRRGKDEIH